MLGGPLIRSDTWPVRLLHSCRRVSLRATSRRGCMEVGSPCMIMSLSNRLTQMQNISASVAVLFMYSPGEVNLCMVSITVSLRKHPWA